MNRFTQSGGGTSHALARPERSWDMTNTAARVMVDLNLPREALP